MKINIHLALLFFLFSGAVFSQKLDMELLKNLKPRNIGPAGMSGRITSIDVVEDSPDIMYVGAASGGVWKSTSGGIKWEPIFNDQTTASIGAIAIQQSNPSVIWVGTGEGNPRNSLNGGDGIYRSLDAGKTWKKMGLAKTRHIHRIIIHPNDPNTIYVGAIGSPWGEHEERGVYKTTDGGKTWKRILFNNIRTGVAEMVMDPSNPNKLIVAMWEHKRDPWFFKSGGPGSGIYVTFDGGDTWEQRTAEEGLPKGELGRIGLAVAPSRPNIIYALVESKKNALYKSVDGGFKWKKVGQEFTNRGHRPFYYSEIYVDPTNENRLYNVFTFVTVSEDGGKSWNELMPAYDVSNGVHPDHHAWWIHPQNPDFMMDGNDGGLNITRDRGETWQFVENLPVGQFYHVAVDNEIPYNVYGGMQDNGSWAGPAYVWKAQGIRNHYWQEISFGDGFDVLPDPENSRFGISTSQQGYAGIYDRITGYVETIRPTNPASDTELRFNWNVGLARDPFDSKTLFFGSQFVHKSTDAGQNWEIISPDLTTNDKEKQKQGESGGLTMDATGAENYTTVIVIEPSYVKQGVIWVGTDDGNVQITKDGGVNWTNVNNLPGAPSGVWITQIKASSKNASEALLVANDYRRFNYAPYAWRTKDYGVTWTRIVDGSDAVSFALSIVEDPIESRLLFLGTDDGLYVSIDAGANWTKWDSEGFPTTNAYDLVIHPREHDLVVGSFGRALWVLDDIRPLREMAKNGGSILKKKLHVFDPPVGYVSGNQEAKGSRFGGDALFNGENRHGGAMLTYVVNVPEEEKNPDSDREDNIGKGKKKKKGKKSEPEVKEDEDKEEKIKYDSVKVEVFKGADLMRTLKWKAPKKNGLQRTSWRMTEKGSAGMSREKRKSKSEPSGVTVLPGMYKMRFTFGDQMDSTEVEVTYDPRIEMSQSAIQAKYDALKALESKAELGGQVVDRIRESIKIATDIKGELKNKDKDGFEDQIKLAKETIDTLNTMMDKFVGEVDDRQGITRRQNESISNFYGSAYYYVSNALHAPGETENNLITKFESEFTKAMEMVNGYFKGDWLTFRKAVENLDTSPFEDYDEIKE